MTEQMNTIHRFYCDSTTALPIILRGGRAPAIWKRRFLETDRQVSLLIGIHRAEMEWEFVSWLSSLGSSEEELGEVTQEVRLLCHTSKLEIWFSAYYMQSRQC